MSLSQGQILNNRYRIVKLLGQGGFGAVYRAWDTNLDEPIALKESFETSLSAQKQFQLEAKLLFKLHHNSLPRVHDFFIIPGQGMYLVMDYIEGEDLGTILEKAGGPLPEVQVLEWISQVCEALIYLHSGNPPIIHRDIKPTNIKITPQGKAMLVDFGIAKVYDPKLSTTAGARAVTPGYSPQEQYGIGSTDERTDVYALGATLYHLLTGVQPPESIQRNLGVKLLPLRQLNPSVSPKVDVVVLRAMEMVPDQRFAHIEEFKSTLSAAFSPVGIQENTATMVLPSNNSQSRSSEKNVASHSKSQSYVSVMNTLRSFSGQNVSRRRAFSWGIVLIAFGAWFFLLPRLSPPLHAFLYGGITWPVSIISFGVIMALIGLFTRLPGWFVPAVFFSGIGTILYYQNVTGEWGSWAFAWALLPGFSGCGILLKGLYIHQRKMFLVGYWTTFLSFLVSLILASFFGFPTLSAALWLIPVAGLGVLIQQRWKP